ncbi:MAG: hypothetical protein WBC44_14605 [Planctomycetaceae bacterium]
MSDPQPPGTGRSKKKEVAKIAAAGGLSEILLQTADAVSLGVADELAAYPLLGRIGLTVALRLSVALVEERGSIRAGLKFFAAWCRARYRRWRGR